MGSGKSTIGKHLAALLNWEFIDSDKELEARCGADIPWIFDIEGEAGFRQRESHVIEDLVVKPRTVVATGGGSVLSPGNRKAIRNAGRVIYLTAPEQVLFQRVEKDQNRPLLQVDNPRAIYQKILQEREPLYREVADDVVMTDNVQAPTTVARNIFQKLDL